MGAYPSNAQELHLCQGQNERGPIAGIPFVWLEGGTRGSEALLGVSGHDETGKEMLGADQLGR